MSWYDSTKRYWLGGLFNHKVQLETTYRVATLVDRPIRETALGCTGRHRIPRVAIRIPRVV